MAVATEGTRTHGRCEKQLEHLSSKCLLDDYRGLDYPIYSRLSQSIIGIFFTVQGECWMPIFLEQVKLAPERRISQAQDVKTWPESDGRIQVTRM